MVLCLSKAKKGKWNRLFFSEFLDDKENSFLKENEFFEQNSEETPALEVKFSGRRKVKGRKRRPGAPGKAIQGERVVFGNLTKTRKKAKNGVYGGDGGKLRSKEGNTRSNSKKMNQNRVSFKQGDGERMRRVKSRDPTKNSLRKLRKKYRHLSFFSRSARLRKSKSGKSGQNDQNNDHWDGVESVEDIREQVFRHRRRKTIDENLKKGNSGYRDISANLQKSADSRVSRGSKGIYSTKKRRNILQNIYLQQENSRNILIRSYKKEGVYSKQPRKYSDKKPLTRLRKRSKLRKSVNSSSKKIPKISETRKSISLQILDCKDICTQRSYQKAHPRPSRSMKRPHSKTLNKDYENSRKKRRHQKPRKTATELRTSSQNYSHMLELRLESRSAIKDKHFENLKKGDFTPPKKSSRRRARLQGSMYPSNSPVGAGGHSQSPYFRPMTNSCKKSISSASKKKRLNRKRRARSYKARMGFGIKTARNLIRRLHGCVSGSKKKAFFLDQDWNETSKKATLRSSKAFAGSGTASKRLYEDYGDLEIRRRRARKLTRSREKVLHKRIKLSGSSKRKLRNCRKELIPQNEQLGEMPDFGSIDKSGRSRPQQNPELSLNDASYFLQSTNRALRIRRDTETHQNCSEYSTEKRPDLADLEGHSSENNEAPSIIDLQKNDFYRNSSQRAVSSKIFENAKLESVQHRSALEEPSSCTPQRLSSKMGMSPSTNTKNMNSMKGSEGDPKPTEFDPLKQTKLHSDEERYIVEEVTKKSKKIANFNNCFKKSKMAKFDRTASDLDCYDINDIEFGNSSLLFEGYFSKTQPLNISDLDCLEVKKISKESINATKKRKKRSKKDRFTSKSSKKLKKKPNSKSTKTAKNERSKSSKVTKKSGRLAQKLRMILPRNLTLLRKLKIRDSAKTKKQAKNRHLQLHKKHKSTKNKTLFLQIKIINQLKRALLFEQNQRLEKERQLVVMLVDSHAKIQDMEVKLQTRKGGAGAKVGNIQQDIIFSTTRLDNSLKEKLSKLSISKISKGSTELSQNLKNKSESQSVVKMLDFDFDETNKENLVSFGPNCCNYSLSRERKSSTFRKDFDFLEDDFEDDSRIFGIRGSSRSHADTRRQDLVLKRGSFGGEGLGSKYGVSETDNGPQIDSRRESGFSKFSKPQMSIEFELNETEEQSGGVGVQSSCPDRPFGSKISEEVSESGELSLEVENIPKSLTARGGSKASIFDKKSSKKVKNEEKNFELDTEDKENFGINGNSVRRREPFGTDRTGEKLKRNVLESRDLAEIQKKKVSFSKSSIDRTYLESDSEVVFVCKGVKKGSGAFTELAQPIDRVLEFGQESGGEGGSKPNKAPQREVLRALRCSRSPQKVCRRGVGKEGFSLEFESGEPQGGQKVERKLQMIQRSYQMILEQENF